MPHVEQRNQYAFAVDDASETDGYEKVQWLVEQHYPWGTWRFTKKTIWINGDQTNLITHFKLRFGEEASHG